MLKSRRLPDRSQPLPKIRTWRHVTNSATTLANVVTEPSNEQGLHFNDATDRGLGFLVRHLNESFFHVDVAPRQPLHFFRPNPSEDAEQVIRQQFKIILADHLQQGYDLSIGKN